MKCSTILLITAILVLTVSQVWATPFYEDGVIKDGDVYSFVSVFNDATVDMTGGIVTSEFNTHNSSTANIFGGSVSMMRSWNSSMVNLHGGIFTDYLLAYGDVVSIYGYGFNYDPLAGNYAGGQLTGFWVDDTPFSIDLWYSSGPGAPTIDTWSNIVLIPEPTTIVLFGLGMLLAKRQRC